MNAQGAPGGSAGERMGSLRGIEAARRGTEGTRRGTENALRGHCGAADTYGQKVPVYEKKVPIYVKQVPILGKYMIFLPILWELSSHDYGNLFSITDPVLHSAHCALLMPLRAPSVPLCAPSVHLSTGFRIVDRHPADGWHL